MQPASSSAASGSLEATETTGFRARIVDGSVTDTKSLVAALNCSQDWLSEEGVREWFRKCVELFSLKPLATLTTNEAQQYASLGSLTVQRPEAKELLESWFDALCGKIEGEFGYEKVVFCINEALRCLDKRVFATNPARLTRLANCLLRKLAVDNDPLTRDTYPTHGVILYAVFNALLLVEKVAPLKLDPRKEDGLFQNFKKRLAKIAGEDHYYPFRYQAYLIEQTLDKLESSSGIAEIMYASGSLIIAALCMAEGIRGAAKLEFKLDAFEAAVKNLKAGTRAWCPCLKELQISLLELHQSGRECLNEAITFNQFRVHCDREIRLAAAAWRKTSRVALRFCVIEQLRMLAVDSIMFDSRLNATGMLIELGRQSFKKGSTMSGWSRDDEILEALLDAFSALRSVKEGTRTQVLDVLASMENEANSDQRVKIDECRRELDVATLDSESVVPETEPEKDVFFAEAYSFVPLLNKQPSVEEMKYALRCKYQEDSFARVTSVFDSFYSKHVKDLEFCLTTLEKSNENYEESSADVEAMPELERHFARQKFEKTWIELEDLFDADDPIVRKSSSATRVLVVGNPGTGKTTLSKKLAYHWACGEWGNRFITVFHLQVRRVRKEDYDGSNLRKGITLATAIVKLCFQEGIDDATFSHYRDLVDVELEKNTTLLICDGLDEKFGSNESIIQEAVSSKCSVLLFSRPFGLDSKERRSVDAEVECVGLNDNQVMNFVRETLSSNKAVFVEKLFFSNRAIWDISHVPINVHILCYIWQTESIANLSKTMTGSLLFLYRKLTHYVWQRFTEKYDARGVDRDSTLTKLNEIGYKAHTSGVIFISQDIINEHVSCKETQDIIKRSAFLLLEVVGREYQFAHLTFQEYFGGCHQATILSLPGESEEMSFLIRHKYHIPFRVMNTFTTEELIRKQGQRGLQRIVEIVDRDELELIGYQHALLRMRIVESYLAVKIERGALAVHDLRSADTLVQSIIPLLEIAAKHKSQIAVVDSLRECPLLCEYFVKDISRLEKVIDELKTPTLQRTERLAIIEGSKTQKEYKIRMRNWLLQQGIEDEKDGSQQPTVHLETRHRQCSDTHGAPNKSKECAEDNSNKAKELDEPLSDREVAAGVEQLLQECKDGNWPVREAAVGQLAASMQQCPDRAEEMVDAVIRASGSVDWPVRQAAVGQLAASMQQCPDRADEIVDAVIRACCDGEPHVKEAGRRQLVASMQHCPDRMGKIVDKLIRACSNLDWRVRQAAVGQLTTSMQQCPARAGEIVDAAIRACGDEDSLVKVAAVGQLTASMQQCHDRAGEFVDAAIRACGDRDSDVRQAAVGQLAGSMQQCPDRAGEIVEAIFRACGDREPRVKEAGRRQLEASLQQWPDRAGEIVDTVLRSCDDRDPVVRQAAVGLLASLQQWPDRAGEIVNTVLRACDDRDPVVRQAAVGQLAASMQQWPDRAGDIVEAMFRACGDREPHVKEAGRRQLAASMQQCPDRAGEIVDAVLHACGNRQPHVRQAAVGQLAASMQQCNERAGLIVDSVIRACGNRQPHVRQSAVGQLTASMQQCPDRAGEIVDTVLRSCDDRDPYVRQAAVGQLTASMQHCHERAEEIVDAVIRACDEDISDVRQAAISPLKSWLQRFSVEENCFPQLVSAGLTIADSEVKQLAESRSLECTENGAAFFVRLPCLVWQLFDVGSPKGRLRAVISVPRVVKESPSSVPKLLQVLQRACRDQSEEIRLATADLVCAHIGSGSGHFSEMASMLEILWGDPSSKVCESVANSMCEISSQRLIDIQFSVSNNALMRFLVPRLFDTPLTVDNNEHEPKRIVCLILSSSQSKQWMKSREEVDNLISAINSELDRTFPGLRDARPWM